MIRTMDVPRELNPAAFVCIVGIGESEGPRLTAWSLFPSRRNRFGGEISVS